ncbi:Echinoderm microtubule-associated protein-like 1 [Hondaea fermentalgiana]|uniref:Echinoderm microtubule-associated protein-like 1 n=1 Tax=Hondaea fermentalgiana TaxID=2315210 RepID=A0A2R5GQE6_9STRA|nr:Echinoderm microtubule-associated protein-like 1 [Hondaea fermentalgiana]|eukprot:GBG30581.1 Echinoderm microtubule-associated protein-like 1 [Hondaea fermentalgiana]
MQDVKMLLSTLKKVGTFVMVQSQFNAWISSAVPAITNEEAQELFRLMDTGNNGRVNCLEFLAGIMMLSCEDFAAKTQFCFELYDLNLNGALCYEELVLMVRSTVLGTLRLIQLRETRSLELLADDKPFEDIAGLALRVYDNSMNRSLSYEEFVSWARGNREIMRFVDEFAIFAQAATKDSLYHHPDTGPNEGDETLPGSYSEYLDAKRTRIGYATGTAVIVQDVHAFALDLESICKQQDLQPSSLCFVGKDLVIGTAQGMLIQYKISARRLEKVVDASMDSQPILHVLEWKAGIVSASTLGELRLWDMGLHPLGTGLETVGSAAASTSFRSEEKLARNAITLSGSASANEPIPDSSIVVSSMCIVNPVLSKVALIATTSGHIFEINLGEKVSSPCRTKIPIVQALGGGGAAPALAVMPQDDSIVVTCSCADARLCVWDSAARRLAYSCLLSSPGVCLAFAPNGEYLAVGLASGEISVRLAGSASLLSEEATRIPRSGLDCSGGPVSICFSPDGLRIAAYFSGGAVHVFDVRRHSLDPHKLFTRAQVLRIDAPSAEVPHRAVLGWSHCSSFLKISIFSVNEPMSLRHHYADIARGGHMLEDSLADVRGISWTSQAYPAEEDLQALPNSLRRDACVFDVALGRLAIGDQNGGCSCVNFPCASETTILRASPADSERVSVVCVKFIQGGAALMAAYANGTMAQWAVVKNDSNIDEEEKEAKQEVASICDLEFEHEIAQRRLVANSDDSCEEVSVQNAASIPEFDRLCEGDETMPLNDWQSSQETPDTQKSDEHQVLLDAMGVHEGRKDAEVVLDWVQGYNAAGKNIQYLFDRRLAFPACGMVTMVGFNTGSGKLQQRFLRPQHAASLQHREIPAGHRVVEVLATTPRRTHIAFAQGSSVHVWDAEKMLMVCEIDLPWAKGGVSHLAFSSDGNLLCVVGGDHMQTVATVEWSTRRVQGFVPSGADSVHDMIWTCEKHFVTVGVRHVTFWKSQRGSAPTSQRGSFASKTGVAVAVQNVYSVCAVDSSTVITGLADGTLAVWDVKTHCITKILIQHQERVGPCFALCFVPTQIGGFLAGNKAGHVTLWTRAGPDDFEEHVLHKAEGKSKGVGVRAISVVSKDQNAQRIAGSNASRLVYGAVAFRDGKITEFIIDTDARSLAHDTAPELLLETHSKGEAWALATHPKEQFAASAADDGKLCLWALDEKKKVAEVEVQRKVISLALSSAEAQDSLGHLAVATDDGFLQVFALFLPPSSTERSLEEMIVEPFSDIDALRDWAQVLRYSPDASLLAAGCHDQSIYIFDRSANYVLLHKLAGHTSFVASLDWSLESAQGEMGLPLWHLQSICGSRELLYWQVSRNAAQRLSSAGFAKDIEWASWTCTNGWAQDDVLFVAANLAVIQRPVRDGRLARQSFFWGHDAAIVAVDVSTDGQLIATGDEAGHVIIWKESTLQQECSLRVEDGVQQVALSALGSLVAVLTYAGAFTIACAKTGQIKATGGSGPAHAMVLVPKSEGDTNADIDVILADETGLRVWTFDPVRNRMSSTAARSPVQGQITCLAFLGGRLVSGHADGALVAWNGASTSVWRIMTKEDLKTPHSRVVLADLATIMPGRDRRELLCISSSGKAIFVDANLDPLPGDGLEALGVALACGDYDRTGRGAWLFSTQQGRLLEYETFSHSSSELVCGHGSAHQGLECAAFSIDGQPHMVTAGTDARICIGFLVIFAANLTRQLLQMSIAFLQGSDHSRDAVRSLQYSGDGQRLAVGSDDGQIRILETRNYALVQKLSLEPPNPVTHLDCLFPRYKSRVLYQS